MLLILQDDGLLYVYPTVEDAMRAIEPLDAEETIRTAYDENTKSYTVQWVLPNTKGTWFFGLLRWCTNGEYRLVTNGDTDSAGLFSTIQSAKLVEPADKTQWVRELQLRLS
jgi:hypothetical protein